MKFGEDAFYTLEYDFINGYKNYWYKNWPDFQKATAPSVSLTSLVNKVDFLTYKKNINPIIVISCIAIEIIFDQMLIWHAYF